MHSTLQTITTSTTFDVDDGSIYTISECPPTPREPIPDQENAGPYTNAITFHDKMIWGSKGTNGKTQKGKTTASG
ncbi:hypothetical protein M413DRAFT_449743 [Hebeloma cylindrosporum]|uniref:Uncharacterized protein n=1 Tax=Hebeloma cylindrosporum TaxID=76867 RepID=A0A0C3BVK6_HEBCY|nr:hypothetical protein M413DRAFT_449743 [Hebeloma cylindrosporum h7]